MGLPSLSLTTTASTTSCTFTERVKLSDASAGLFWPICCAPALMPAASKNTRPGRIRILEPQPNCGLQAAHRIGSSGHTELSAVDRSIPAGEDGVIEHIGSVDPCNEVELCAGPKCAFERGVETELAGAGD